MTHCHTSAFIPPRSSKTTSRSATARACGTTSTSATVRRFGEECIVGDKTYIAYDVRIGNRVKINAMVYICNGVTIEDGVMISAGMIFTNDRFPRATTQRPDAAALLRPRRAHAADAGARRGDDRRRVHHRQRSDDRPVRDGRHGLGRHPQRAAIFTWSSATRPASIGCVCRCGEPLLKWDDWQTARRKRVACSACGLNYQIVGQQVIELNSLAAAAAELTLQVDSQRSGFRSC